VESKVEQYRGETQMLHFDTDDRNQVLAAMVLKAEWDHLAEGLLPPSRLALRPVCYRRLVPTLGHARRPNVNNTQALRPHDPADA
jgi:hypothetical protein